MVTTKVQVDEDEVGSIFLFTFRGSFNPQMRISEIEMPSVVEFDGMGGNEAWGATTIRFQLDPIYEGTHVRSWHQMGPERSAEAVASANFTWGYYLNSLRLFCEQGEGTPYRSGIPGARVGATTVD
jgi:hypothetical protein